MKKYLAIEVEVVTWNNDDVLTGSNELPIIPGCFEEENELPIFSPLYSLSWED